MQFFRWSKNVIESLLGRVSSGEDLSEREMSGAISAIMEGGWSDDQIAILLNGLRAKGETVDEIAGAAAALRQHMTPIRSCRVGLLDTCGTGGDGSNTFNISTAAAFVVAAAGVPVAKHGNRGVTSRSGSANVLAELGVAIDAPIEIVEACIDELGICFCYAPLWHSSMKRVAAVRQKLGVPTIFNLLGPLCNPAGAPFQLLGVGKPELRPLLAEALLQLGTKHALVVCGDDGLDEVTLAGPTSVSEIAGGRIHERRFSPADFGLTCSPLDTLRVDGPASSAAMIRSILAGELGPARDIVVLNAAAALLAAEKATDPLFAAKTAQIAIDDGSAGKLLENLVERTRRCTDR